MLQLLFLCDSFTRKQEPVYLFYSSLHLRNLIQLKEIALWEWLELVRSKTFRGGKLCLHITEKKTQTPKSAPVVVIPLGNERSFPSLNSSPVSVTSMILVSAFPFLFSVFLRGIRSEFQFHKRINYLKSEDPSIRSIVLRCSPWEFLCGLLEELSQESQASEGRDQMFLRCPFLL